MEVPQIPTLKWLLILVKLMFIIQNPVLNQVKIPHIFFISFMVIYEQLYLILVYNDLSCKTFNSLVLLQTLDLIEEIRIWAISLNSLFSCLHSPEDNFSL